MKKLNSIFVFLLFYINGLCQDSKVRILDGYFVDLVSQPCISSDVTLYYHTFLYFKESPLSKLPEKPNWKSLVDSNAVLVRVIKSFNGTNYDFIQKAYNERNNLPIDTIISTNKGLQNLNINYDGMQVAIYKGKLEAYYYTEVYQPTVENIRKRNLIAPTISEYLVYPANQVGYLELIGQFFYPIKENLYLNIDEECWMEAEWSHGYRVEK